MLLRQAAYRAKGKGTVGLFVLVKSPCVSLQSHERFKKTHTLQPDHPKEMRTFTERMTLECLQILNGKVCLLWMYIALQILPFSITKKKLNRWTMLNPLTLCVNMNLSGFPRGAIRFAGLCLSSRSEGRDSREIYYLWWGHCDTSNAVVVVREQERRASEKENAICNPTVPCPITDSVRICKRRLLTTWFRNQEWTCTCEIMAGIKCIPKEVNRQKTFEIVCLDLYYILKKKRG